MEIRRLAANDISLYGSTISRFIFESMSNGVYMESYTRIDAEKKTEELKQYLINNMAIVCGAFTENKLIGFIWGYKYPFRDDMNRLYISILHVDERYRKQKIGKSLLENMEMIAKNENLLTVFLHAKAINEGAICFYKRIGYRLERVQLVKNYLVESKDLENAVGEILTSQMVENNINDFIELFLLNTKAHILTENFNYEWCQEKIRSLLDYIDREKAIAVGYYADNRPVGFAWAFPYNYYGEERYLLNAIVVSPVYRNQHIATKLFYTIEKTIEKKSRKLYTLVDAANIAAYKFYLKHGMKEEQFQFVKELNENINS